jgi:glycosyltransferase involved in cell wall biosynthesis
MIRAGFTMIGGRNWTGGSQYLLNLLRVVTTRCPDRVKPVLFLGDDLATAEMQPFHDLRGVEVVVSRAFRQGRRLASLLQTLTIGRDAVIEAEFSRHHIDVVFEAAQFFGRNLGRPAVAWIPDFQHRLLRHLFPFGAFWKRELGFRAQINANRTIMLSSEDSRRLCEQLYPQTRGRSAAVRFAVDAQPGISLEGARAVAEFYGLPQHFFFLPNQFWQHKNHGVVVAALEKLRREGRTDITVAASGNTRDPRNPTHFEDLMSRVRRSNLDTQFRVLGMIPREHLLSLMLASTAVINPSLFEGWSTTVEEAKSLGVPLILSDLEVHREQAPADATFFSRESPDSLAHVLSEFKPLDLHQRARRAHAAAAATEVRLAEFANQFATILESAAGTSRQ